jgi:hypothetical protein
MMMTLKATAFFCFAAFIVQSATLHAAQETNHGQVAEQKNEEIKPIQNRVTAGPDVAIGINICRIKSIIRIAEAPDLYVNESKVAELSNGARISISLSGNDAFTLKTTANPFLCRFKDELLFKGKNLLESVYVIVNTERNLSQGVSILLGGMITESVRQSMEVGDSKNWTVRIVSQLNYQSECDK